LRFEIGEEGAGGSLDGGELPIKGSKEVYVWSLKNIANSNGTVEDLISVTLMYKHLAAKKKAPGEKKIGDYHGKWGRLKHSSPKAGYM